MDDIIPNIYHFIYENNKYLENIDIFSYFSIKSTLEINNPKLIYFYYINLPTGYLWNKIKPNLECVFPGNNSHCLALTCSVYHFSICPARSCLINKHC